MTVTATGRLEWSMVAAHPFPNHGFLFILDALVTDSLLFLVGWLLLGWVLVSATRQERRTAGQPVRVHLPPWVQEHSRTIGVALGVLLLVYLWRRRRSR